MLTIVPIEFDEACEFVSRYHRHHRPPVRVKFSIACADDARPKDNAICGVAMVGRPVSRHIQDGWTLEIVRLCTDSTPHVASKLAARAWRIVQAMGYRKLITYILENESGISLIAAGMRCVGKTTGGSWDREDRPRVDKHPTQPKLRFEYQPQLSQACEALEPIDELERRCVEDGAQIVIATDRKTGSRHRAIDMTEAKK